MYDIVMINDEDEDNPIECNKCGISFYMPKVLQIGIKYSCPECDNLIKNLIKENKNE
jgi:hypothetical protein